MTGTHPPFRQRAFAAFFDLERATGESRKSLRRWLAEQMGIEERYLIIADMDETECVTVEAECRARADGVTKRRVTRRPRGTRGDK
jgi:hypothetical protein